MTRPAIRTHVITTRLITGITALALVTDTSIPMLRSLALIAGLYFCQMIIEKLSEVAEHDRKCAEERRRIETKKAAEMANHRRMLELFRAHMNNGEKHA